MNRTHLFRALSLGLASLALAGASLAASPDVSLLVQADGLMTNEMRAEAELAAITALVEADGLVTAQLRQEIEVARLAEADGLPSTVLLAATR